MMQPILPARSSMLMADTICDKGEEKMTENKKIFLMRPTVGDEELELIKQVIDSTKKIIMKF